MRNMQKLLYVDLQIDYLTSIAVICKGEGEAFISRAHVTGTR